MADKTLKGRATKVSTWKEKEKRVKKISVKPLMPLQRLNSEELSVDINRNSPNEKSQPIGSIHEILEQMKVSPNSPDSKAGQLAAQRWKERSAKQIYADFCSETSFTALTRIHKASHWYKSIIWLVVCLTMLTWLIIQCVWLFQKYLSYPVEVKIEVKAVPDLTFPSVTICNLNPLKRSMMYHGAFQDITAFFELDDVDILYDDYIEDQMEEWKEDNETQWLDYSESIMDYMKKNSFNRWDALENDSAIAEKFYSEMDDSFMASYQYSNVAVTITESEFKKYGHQKEDFILSCTWQGVSCSPANFTYHRSNTYGNCYTLNAFNNGKTAMSTNYAGPLMGLVLELNIEQDEYVPALSPDAGVRVMIHQRGIYPFPQDEGISVPPGFKTSIGMSKTELIRLPPPHGECGDSETSVTNLFTRDFGTSYSKQTCLKSCVQNILLNVCGCFVAFFYVPANSTVCPMSSNCTENTIMDSLDACNNKCPTPCQEAKYDLTTSMSKWPSEQYEDHLDAKIKKSTSAFMDDEGRQDSEDTLAKIEIYFKELMFEKIEQQKAYESQNLISDIGGQLGLWLGLSAITVGELIEFFASLGRLIGAKVCKKKPTSPTLSKVSADLA